jgi:hypothetical protein
MPPVKNAMAAICPGLFLKLLTMANIITDLTKNFILENEWLMFAFKLKVINGVSLFD